MYRAPIAEIAHTLKHTAGLKAALDEGRLGDLTEDLADAILEEAGRFAADEIAPLYKVGDEIGAVWKDGAVTTPPRTDPRIPPAANKGNKRFACRVSITIPAMPQTKTVCTNTASATVSQSTQ